MYVGRKQECSEYLREPADLCEVHKSRDGEGAADTGAQPQAVIATHDAFLAPMACTASVPMRKVPTSACDLPLDDFPDTVTDLHSFPMDEDMRNALAEVRLSRDIARCKRACAPSKLLKKDIKKLLASGVIEPVNRYECQYRYSRWRRRTGAPDW